MYLFWFRLNFVHNYYIDSFLIFIEKEKATLEKKFKIYRAGYLNILYDSDILVNPDSSLFKVDRHLVTCSSLQSPTLPTPGIGRAKVVYFEYKKNKLVLKHYYRGGLLACLVRDTYLSFDIEKTRSFKEFRLLQQLQQLNLPVPEVVAAQVEKHWFFYRADLITRELENAETLADYLTKQAADVSVWKKVGACIRSFHQHNVYHADLNARNIMLIETGTIYLIDFDNSYFRENDEQWMMANLSRLKRSLLKFKKNVVGFHFDKHDWLALLDGYNS